MAQKTVKIKSGDTLSKIAKTYGTTVSAIASANKIKDVNKISAGSSLSIPGSTTTKTTKSSNGSNSNSSTSTSGGGMTTAQVKALQTSLNTKGANLVVDGKLGPLTKAAQAKYGSSSSSPVAIRQTQASSYSNLPGAIISSPKQSSSKKSWLGNLFSDVGKKFKDSLGASAANSYNGYVFNPKTFEDGTTYTPPTNVLAQKIAQSGLPEVSQVVQKFADTVSSGNKANTTSSAEPYVPNSQTMDLISTEGNGLNPDITGEGKLYSTDTSSTKSIDTSTVQLEQTMAEASAQSPSTPTNANIISKANQLATGLKSDLNSGNTAWMSSGSKGEFQNTKIVNYTTNMATQFTTPEQAVAFYKTPEGIATLPEGVKPEDVISKVKPVVNGIVSAQTTPEYLTKLGKAPAALAHEKSNTEAQMTNIANYATDYEKTILTQATQDKLDAENQIEALQVKELKEEDSIRDRAELAIDKLKAEKKAAEAEIEMNRLTSKTNLTEFLAKIGALRTDGNAQTGLELLEQKYQAMKLQSNNAYKFAIREAQLDMNDKINTLESNIEQRIIDINSDLSKSEREINLEVMKLRYETKMKGLEYVSKFQDSIKTENEKAKAKSEKMVNDYNEILLELMVNKNIPYDIAKTMINAKGQINATQQNADTLKSFGVKVQEPKPDYKGETLNLGKDTKIATKIMNTTGMTTSDIIQLQKELEQGYTLEQIAKNNSMPTSIYNVLRPYVSSPNK